MIDEDAEIAQLARQRDDRLGRLPQRRQVGDLRPEMDVQPDDLHAASVGESPAQIGYFIDRHPELVGLETGGDVRMTPGVDIGIHA